MKQALSIKLTVGSLLLVIFGFIGAIIWTVSTAKPSLKAQLEGIPIVLFDAPRLLPEVVLTQHDGSEFRNEAFLGRWHLINFGYTYCPDICPTNMADMRQAYLQLEQRGLADRVQFWMVTVDPARDTIEKLAQYVPFFQNDFIGLTGDIKDISTLATQLGAVFYQEGEGEYYTVAHSDNYAIINPQGQLIGLLRPPHKPSHISESFEILIENTQ